MNFNKFFVRYENKITLTESFKLLLLAIPFIIFVFAFAYVPLFGWAYSFFEYKPGTPLADTAFVGLKYFFKVFRDWKELARVLRNTLIMSSLGLLSSPLPVVFAILLNEIKGKRFKKLVQTTTTLPNFISWIIVYSIVFSIFSADGLFNALKAKLGMSPAAVNILGNVDLVWLFQWSIGIWKGLGWSVIIYLAAIAGVDGELYDAAKVDGANRFQSIIHITVPGLMPTYFVLLLLGISNILNSGFDQYFVFYNPMVSSKIEVLDYYVYKIGILSNDYPFSIALGMYKSFIGIALLFTANAVSKKVRGQTIV